MRKLISGFTFVVGLLLSNASAGVTIEDAQTDYAAGGERRAFALKYFMAQAQALSYANNYLEWQGQAPLFCPPKKLAITGENAWDITSDYIQERNASSDYHFDMFLLPALADAFPCD